MKKLMFAMAIAATVCMAQANAPAPIGTLSGFEDLTVSNKFDFSAVGYTDWSATGSEGEVDDTMVLAYDKNAEDYVAANGDKFLALEGVQNLAKNINTEIGEGLYIDTMVKFTAAEEAPTPGEGDKLVVWLKETPGENDNPSTYTLMVTAGYYTDEIYSIASTNYTINGTFAPDVWYNLKVKAITGFDQSVNQIPLTGFVILINNNVVATSEAIGDTSIGKFDPEAFDGGAAGKYVGDGTFSIFPSLLDYNAEGYDTITQLAFSGSGAIDTVAAFQGDCDPDAPTPTEGWVDPTDADAIAAIEGKQAAEAYPSLAGTAVAAVDAKKLTIWATGIGSVDFSDAATGINTTAFLLNIANSSSAADIEEAEAVAKEAIKITAISFDENGDVVLTYPATYGNGNIVVEGSVQLPAEWHDKVDADKFFRTKLVLDEVAAPAVGD